MVKWVKPKFSNGTELCFWLERCNGCSRNKNEPYWCNLQTAVITGQMTITQAKHIGFDEEGNIPDKPKCYRVYKRKFTDKLTGDLL